VRLEKQNAPRDAAWKALQVTLVRHYNSCTSLFLKGAKLWATEFDAVKLGSCFWLKACSFSFIQSFYYFVCLLEKQKWLPDAAWKALQLKKNKHKMMIRAKMDTPLNKQRPKFDSIEFVCSQFCSFSEQRSATVIMANY